MRMSEPISKGIRLMLALLAGLALTLSVVACGDDDSNGSQSAVGAQEGQVADEATAAGEEDAGEPVKLEKKTVGYLQFTNEAEIAVRIQTATKEAATAIGWDFIACDGQGDPRKQGACGSTLIDRGADIIIANSISPEVTGRALKQAQQKDIPWFIVGGLVPEDPGITAEYVPDEVAMSNLISDAVLDETGGEGTIATVNYSPAIEVYNTRRDVFKQRIGETDMEIVSEGELDYTDLVGSIQKQTNNLLSKTPDVDVILSYTNDIPPVVQTIRASGSRSGDDWPIIAGWYGDLVNLDAIRNGDVFAVVEWPIEGDVWAAVDQAAQFFARDEQPPADTAGLTEEYSLKFIEPSIVSADNLPPKGEYAAPNADFVSYFTAKWGTEFGE